MPVHITRENKFNETLEKNVKWVQKGKKGEVELTPEKILVEFEKAGKTYVNLCCVRENEKNPKIHLFNSLLCLPLIFPHYPASPSVICFGRCVCIQVFVPIFVLFTQKIIISRDLQKMFCYFLDFSVVSHPPKCSSFLKNFSTIFILFAVDFKAFLILFTRTFGRIDRITTSFSFLTLLN